MAELKDRRCMPCEGGVPAMDLAQAAQLQKALHPRWQLAVGGKRLEARFSFKNYWRTSAFVNAVAWIAHQEDHHPELCFGYDHCTVQWWTHAVDGLTENDFICAAKTDALLAEAGADAS